MPARRCPSAARACRRTRRRRPSRDGASPRAAARDDPAAWRDGTWRDGTWGDGTWGDGTWGDGTWDDGTWGDGTWRDSWGRSLSGTGLQRHVTPCMCTVGLGFAGTAPRACTHVHVAHLLCLLCTTCDSFGMRRAASPHVSISWSSSGAVRTRCVGADLAKHDAAWAAARELNPSKKVLGLAQRGRECHELH